MIIDWTPLADLIETHDRFLVTTHVRPDGDALGSEVGMAGLLRQKGKDVRVVNASPTPPRYDFLDPDGKLFEHFNRRPRRDDRASAGPTDPDRGGRAAHPPVGQRGRAPAGGHKPREAALGLAAAILARTRAGRDDRLGREEPASLPGRRLYDVSRLRMAWIARQ
jgi:hypothetical protein